MTDVAQILKEEVFTKDRILTLLEAEGDDVSKIYHRAAEIKRKYIGNKVHLRGLIELTNKCAKNCFYCGIASSIKSVERFMLNMDEVEKAIRFTHANNYGSLVIQTGELQSKKFTDTIEEILWLTQKIGGGNIGITLSCGEQSEETYQRWRKAGAQRYLLRIESSNRDLYYKLHPQDKHHDYDTRLHALDRLKHNGFQTGTGVMIGLPFQTTEDLANDLLFMQNIDIDMCGMGPYIEHENTSLYQYKQLVPTKEVRLELSLKMIAILRMMMKDINIASTTAMQTLVNGGREMALKAGANILMPNTTPGVYREHYALYNDKPGLNEEAADSKVSIERLIKNAGCVPAYGEQGNSRHFSTRISR